MNNKDDIVERLNALMKDRGLSLRGVEKLTNVPFSTVGRLKRGDNVSDEARERVRCFLDGEPYSAPHKELSEHIADISALFAAKDARIAELEAEVERLSNPWVPIGYIPKEWKRVALFPNSRGKIEHNCAWAIPLSSGEDGDCEWLLENGLPINFIPTHAMLSPKEPTP